MQIQHPTEFSLSWNIDFHPPPMHFHPMASDIRIRRDAKVRSGVTVVLGVVFEVLVARVAIKTKGESGNVNFHCEHIDHNAITLFFSGKAKSFHPRLVVKRNSPFCFTLWH